MRLFHPDVPFAPRRSPFFYGWVVLLASTVGVVMSIPGQTMGVSVFTDSLIGATGVSRFALSNAYLAGTLASGMMLPWGGRLFDRFGARLTAMGAAFALGVTLLALSAVDRIAAAIAGAQSFVDGEVTVWLTLASLFVALRFSGQGMLTMVSRTMLGKWFERRRGLASAISGVVISFGFAAAPIALNAWIEASTWRGAWVGMGALVFVVMGAVAWLLYRDNPEECGLRMDGAKSGDRVPVEVSNTREEALRSLAFWAVSLGLAVHGLVITGFTFHIVDLGAEAGLGRSEAIRIFLPIAVVSTISGAVVGWAADKTKIRTLLFVMLSAQLLGYAAATQLETPVGLGLTVVGLGVTGGFFGPLSSVPLPRFFGRTHLGAIAGVQSMMLVIGSALGPSAFALSKRLTDSYAPGLLACLVLPTAVFALNLVARHPRDVPPVAAA